MFRNALSVLSLMVLVLCSACSSQSFKRVEVYDSRTPAQQIAAGESAAKSVTDVTDLYGRDLRQGIALLDRVPGKFDTYPNWGAQWSILTAAYDHSLEQRERLAAGTGISAQELNADSQHRDAQHALNRAWVLQASPTANPEAVLNKLEAPKPWPAPTPLPNRIGSGNVLAALDNERIHAFNYAGLMTLMVDTAKSRGLDGVRYWEIESQDASAIYAIVEADLAAAQQGISLSERRITSAYDMAAGTRTLTGYRLSEASAPVLYARAVLSPEQARALKGSYFADVAALGQFRAFWIEARSKVNRGWVSTVIAQSPALRTTLFRDIPDDKLAERGLGLLDSELDKSVDGMGLASLWWCFRAIPENMFYGDGSYSLPAPMSMASDSSLIETLQQGSRVRIFTPQPAPPVEDKSVPTGPATPSASASAAQ